MTPWPDPHPDRSPLDEEYSQLLDPAKRRPIRSGRGDSTSSSGSPPRAPRDRVELEGSLLKAMFTGLVIDLLAMGDRERLRAALDLDLDRLNALLDTP